MASLSVVVLTVVLLMFSIARMEKQCPNFKATMAADVASRPGFACYECIKCAFVAIEVFVREPVTVTL